MQCFIATHRESVILICKWKHLNNLHTSVSVRRHAMRRDDVWLQFRFELLTQTGLDDNVPEQKKTLSNVSIY